MGHAEGHLHLGHMHYVPPFSYNETLENYKGKKNTYTVTLELPIFYRLVSHRENTMEAINPREFYLTRAGALTFTFVLAAEEGLVGAVE